MREWFKKALLLLFVFCQPNYSEIHLGMQTSFLSISDYSDTTQSRADNRLGYSAGLFGHYTFHIWMPNAIAVGPYFEYGKPESGTISGAQVSTSPIWRTGLDVKSAFEISRKWQFYVRLSLGYERHNNSFSTTTNNTTITYDGPTTGLSGGGSLGLQFLINKSLFLFTEGSVISGNMTEQIENASVTTLSSKKRTFISYRLSLGLAFRLF